MNKFKKLRILDTEYSYEIGVIRALEIKLFTERRFEEYISSVDINELISALHDSDYGYYFRNISNPHQYEKAFENYRFDLYRDIGALIGKTDIMRFIRAKLDHQNLTVLLKSNIAEEDFSSYCINLGFIPLEELRPILKDELYEKLPDYMEKAVRAGIESYFTHHHNLQLLNFSIDNVMADFLTGYTGNEFLLNYYKFWVDITNLKTVLRLLFQNKFSELADYSILPGGFISEDDIISLKPDEEDGLFNLYKKTYYSELLNYREAFPKLEKHSESLLLSYLKSIAFESIGVEPIISYLFFKENEIRNLRMIFIGKINGVDNSIIKERLII